MADNTYIPKYFELYELLPPELYVGDLYTSEIARQRAFASYFDTKLLITIDKVRDIIGKPLICNTWFQDGNRRKSFCVVLKSRRQRIKLRNILRIVSTVAF